MDAQLERTAQAPKRYPQESSLEQEPSLLGPAPSLPTFSTRDELLAQTLGTQQASSATPSQDVLNSTDLSSIEVARKDFEEALAAVREGRVTVPEAHRTDLEASLDQLVDHLGRLNDLSALSNVTKTPSLSRQSSSYGVGSSTEATNPTSTFESLDNINLAASTLKQSTREVVVAEQELLWSRVDDLLVHVSLLCRESPSQTGHRERRASIESESEYSISDLPVYTFSKVDQHASDAAPPRYALDEKQATASSSTPLQPLNTLNSDEKAHLELQTISAAIERLYGVSPQLSNQRASAPDLTSKSKKEVREIQLMRLGKAIERLSKGRLEDQRAVLAPAASRSASAAGKRRQTPEQELDMIMEAMDKASAGSSMVNQRVALSDRQTALLLQARKTAQEAAQAYGFDSALGHVDPVELARREHILDRTGHGRIASQDAPKPLGPAAVSNGTIDKTATLTPRPSLSRMSSGGLRRRLSALLLGTGEEASSMTPLPSCHLQMYTVLNDSSTDSPQYAIADLKGTHSLRRPRAQTYSSGQAQAVASL